MQITIDTLVIDQSVLDGLASIPRSLAAIAAELKVSNELKIQELKLQEELVGLVRRQWRPARPTGLKYQLLGETEGMAADILTYSIVADAPSDPDVVSRKLKVEVDGEVKRDDVLGATTTDFGSVEVPQDSQVKISLTDVDDGGNESVPLVSEFQALDTIVPPSPTGLNVTLTGEAENPDPTPVDPAPPTDPV